jgi:hypothetical protein
MLHAPGNAGRGRFERGFAMSGYVLFQMWEPFRKSLIAEHLFYVEQARKRLLSQFDDMEAEADKAAKDWLDQNQSRFDPDRDDPDSFYEAAYENGIEFYQLLSDMRDEVRLSVVAGMFHAWDKQLRDWLVKEMRHWHHGKIAQSRVWSADFGKIVELLESFGWKIGNEAYFSKIDACRLVVNVYKHGDGKSLEDLKANYPEYIANLVGDTKYNFLWRTLDHTHLKVNDEQITSFSDAIIAFWRGVPEEIRTSELISMPDWLKKAIASDKEKLRQRK